MIMNYKESNLQQLSKSIKSLLDDDTVTPDELYELILLTIGESINTHRDSMQRAQELRSRLMTNNAIGNFRGSSPYSSKPDTISHSEYWDQYKRNE